MLELSPWPTAKSPRPWPMRSTSWKSSAIRFPWPPHRPQAIPAGGRLTPRRPMRVNHEARAARPKTAARRPARA
uniref:Uncharacterized protein n=1 Tax=Phenylobacterium glaciei TaxID=2803784 RepID=A0A974S8R0_9CAUL|nr:hypothetical protein JKL49_04225 [Phenylobacterium glaciei]